MTRGFDTPVRRVDARVMTFGTEASCRVMLAAMIAGIVIIGLPHRLRADRAGGRVSVRRDPIWFWCGIVIVGPPAALGCLGFLIRPEWVSFGELPLSAPWRWLGGVFAALGVGLFGWMFRHLGLNVTSTSVPRSDATLVTGGPYRWVRHPMYSAVLLLTLAAALLTANGIVLCGGLAMFGLLAARSGAEERNLIGKFGDAYRAYQARTGRFLPRFRGTT